MNNSNAIQAVPTENIIEQVITKGDLASLTPNERANFYSAVCTSIGLNPLTQPFEYIKLNGKMQLYAKKGATDQLRKIYGVSIEVISKEIIGDLYVVTARGRDASGRCDEEIGAVSIKALKDEALANAMMKAITKAKRRVTLSMFGLGMLDETEVETIPSAQKELVHVGYAKVVKEPISIPDHPSMRLYEPPRDPKTVWIEENALEILGMDWRHIVLENLGIDTESEMTDAQKNVLKGYIERKHKFTSDEDEAHFIDQARAYLQPKS